jgi:Ca2+/Na+ antiporter
VIFLLVVFILSKKKQKTDEKNAGVHKANGADKKFKRASIIIVIIAFVCDCLFCLYVYARRAWRSGYFNIADPTPYKLSIIGLIIFVAIFLLFVFKLGKKNPETDETNAYGVNKANGADKKFKRASIIMAIVAVVCGCLCCYNVYAK